MASRHHAQRENESGLPPLTHAILLAQHASIATGRSAGLPYCGNRARCQPGVRAAQPAQRDLRNRSHFISAPSISGVEQRTEFGQNTCGEFHIRRYNAVWNKLQVLCSRGPAGRSSRRLTTVPTPWCSW